MTINPITTTNNLILRVTGNADPDPDFIRQVMGASAPPVHRSGPWYTVEIAGAAYGDDKPREIVLPCGVAIKVVHVTDKSLDNLFFFQKTPRTPPNFRVLDEHDNMLCGDFEAPPSPPSPTLTTQPVSRSCHIFWDIENCSIGKGDDLGAITNRILEVIKDAVGYEWTPGVVRKSVYIDTAKPTTYRASDLEDYLWEKILYNVKDSADLSIMRSITMLVDEHRNRPANERPVVCLITGDRDFSFTLQHLKTNGWKDVVLIHTPQARETFTEHAAHAVNWADIRSGAWSPSAVPRHVRDFVYEMLSHEGESKTITEVEMHVHTKCRMSGLSVPNRPLDDILRAEPTAIDRVWVEDGKLSRIVPARNVLVQSPLVMKWLSKYLVVDEKMARITTRHGQHVDVTAKTLRDRDQAAEMIEELGQRLTATEQQIPLDREQWTEMRTRDLLNQSARTAWEDEFRIVSKVDEYRTGTIVRIVGERAHEAVVAFRARFVPAQLCVPAADLESRMVTVEHVVRSRLTWLYLNKFFDLFKHYLLVEYDVTMSRGAPKMPVSLHGPEENVVRAVRYLTTQLTDEKMRYWKIDIQDCPSHKYQAICGMVHAMWHMEIARRQAESQSETSDPLRVGSRGIAFISVSPPPPKDKKNIPSAITFPVLMRVEVWMHENHVSDLFEDITTSITNADRHFKFMEVSFADKREEFYDKIMSKIGQKHSRDFIYQTFGVSGVTWKYDKATMQLWGIRDGCVDRAYAWITK